MAENIGRWNVDVVHAERLARDYSNRDLIAYSMELHRDRTLEWAHRRYS